MERKTKHQQLATKYHFSDFTEKNYEKLLKLAKEYYKFSLYTDFTKDPHVLWRHDIDFSVHRSLRLAEIENKIGACATHFVRLHSEFYNIFEKDVYIRIKKIMNLGHEIGLHFDYDFYSIDSFSELEEKLSLEKNILEKLLLTKINVFSFHNPESKNALQFNRNTIGDMINVYGNKIKKNYYYCSDSNGYWRFKRLENVLREKPEKYLHILTHPEWWQKHVMSPRERVQRCIDLRAKHTKEFYNETIRKLRRKNVG